MQFYEIINSGWRIFINLQGMMWEVFFGLHQPRQIVLPPAEIIKLADYRKLKKQQQKRGVK